MRVLRTGATHIEVDGLIFRSFEGNLAHGTRGTVGDFDAKGVAARRHDSVTLLGTKANGDGLRGCMVRSGVGQGTALVGVNDISCRCWAGDCTADGGSKEKVERMHDGEIY